MAKTTEELLKDRLAELFADRDAKQAALVPVRAKYNAAHAEAQALLDGVAADAETIKAAMPDLQKVENEISQLCRVLDTGWHMSDGATPEVA